MRLFKVVAPLAFAALAPLAGQAQAQEVVLKFAHFLTPASPGHQKLIVPWCEKVSAESNGRIQCQHYPAMQLGGTPPQLLQQVRDGVADLIWTLPGYTPGRFPTSEVFELPFISTTHEATSRALWDFVQKNSMKEFEGIKPIATFTPGPYHFHFREKQVKTLEDLKGLKVRAPSRLGTKLLAALGTSPVGMPVPQTAEALSRGVIDATVVPWEVVPAVKAHELTKYHAEVGGDRAMLTATMILAMNQKRYDSLPPDLKKVIDNNSGRETSAWAAAQLKSFDAVGRQAAVSRGNTVYQIPASEAARWEAAAKPVTDEWIKDTPEGKRLYDEARALVRQYSQ